MMIRSIPLRGHNVFWNFERWVPNWLVPMDGNQVKDEMLRRIEYLIPFYRDTWVWYYQAPLFAPNILKLIC